MINAYSQEIRTYLLSEIFYGLVFPQNEVVQTLPVLLYLIVTEVFPHVVALETEMVCYNKVLIIWTMFLYIVNCLQMLSISLTCPAYVQPPP